MIREKIKLSNSSISYFDEDTNKRKVIFIHGFNSSSSSVAPLLSIKDRDYDIVGVNMPGNGGSTSEETFSVELYQSVLKEFIDIKGYDDVILIGHSLGGASVMSMAQDNRVKKIALVAPFNPFVYSSWHEGMEGWLWPQNMDSAVDSLTSMIWNKDKVLYFKNIHSSAQAFLKLVEASGNMFDHLLNNQILNKEYQETTLMELWANAPSDKVILIQGDHDLFVHKDSAAEQVNKFGFKLNIIENCGHSPIYEYPEQVNKIINTL